MNDRAVLRGGPFNDECVGGEGTDISQFFVIYMTDADGIHHVYELDLENADIPFFTYAGVHDGPLPEGLTS